MTPGSLMALVEDNVRHYENILTGFQTTLLKATAQDMLLTQDTIANLRRIEAAPIEHPALDQQVRHALQERQQQESKYRAQLAEVENDITQLVSEFRALVNQREQRLPLLWQAHILHPDYTSLMRQGQDIIQARQRLQDSLAQLVEERDKKMPAYETNPFYVYLRTRRYGTDDYSRGRLFRQCDDWLASKVNYRENRRNELILRSMPDSVATLVEAHNARLLTLDEQNVANWAKAGGGLRADATTLRRTLLAKQIIAAKTRANAAYDQLVLFIDCEDSYTQDIERWIDAQLGNHSIDDILEMLVNECPEHSNTLNQYWSKLADSSNRVEGLEENVDKALEDYHHAKELEWGLRSLREEETECDEQCTCACHHDEDFQGQCPCMYDDERYYTYSPELDCTGLITGYMKRNLALDDLMSLFNDQRLLFNDQVPEPATTAPGAATELSSS